MVERLPTTVRRLVEAAASVAGQTELSNVLRITVKTAMELTGAKYGALGVIGSHGTLSDFIFEGVDRELADRIGRHPVGRGVLGAIRDKPLRLANLSAHADAVGFPSHHPAMESFLGVPVGLGGYTFGNLYLADKDEGEFTAEDEALVLALAVIAGSAVSRARLERRLERAALVEDRERIARDMHDGVIQELFAVGLALQASVGADPTATDDGIRRAMVSIDGAMQRLREYIFDLQAQVPDFEARLRSVVGQAATEIDIRVETSGDFSKLPRPFAEQLIQFAREAISNAIRHSGAATIQVRAAADDGTVRLEIEDDGIGFDVEANAEGMGIANMRERISTLGGLFVAYGPNRRLWASVHLVGGFHWGGLADSPASVFDEMMALNARSCYLACRAAAAAMKRGGDGGRIVNVTARPGLDPTAGASMVAYTGAKAAVAAMTQAMAEELAPNGIWVNAVAPSIMDTPRNRADMPNANHAEWPTPEEVAETITFLASPSNRTTRGALVPVYGRA